MRLILICLVAAGFVPGDTAGPAKTPIAPGAARLADQLAGKLAGLLETLPADPQRKPRIGLFPFGDAKADGRATRAAGETARVIQGELYRKLSELDRSDRYIVLSTTGLKNAFESARVDVTELDPKDPKATAQVIDRVGLTAVVVGSYEEQDVSVRVRAMLIRADGNTDEVATAFAEQAVVATRDEGPLRKTMARSRFRVDVLDKDGKALPMAQVQDDGGPRPSGAGPKPVRLMNTYWLPLDRSRRGETYSIKVEYLGAGAGLYHNTPEKDARRVYGCALRVDGVDSFAHPVKAEPEFLALTPENCSYWLLTPPGHVLLPLEKPVEGRNYEVRRLAEVTLPAGSPVDPVKGHAVQRIPGFQVGADVARRFTFAVPHEALAYQIGLTEEIGLITAHFAPELIPGDTLAAPSLLTPTGPMGTLAGTTVDHETTPIDVKLHDEFEEVVRIYYYEKQDGQKPPVPEGKLVAVPIRN